MLDERYLGVVRNYAAKAVNLTDFQSKRYGNSEKAGISNVREGGTYA